MMATRRSRLTKSERVAIQTLMTLAEGNTCTCAGNDEPGDGRGWNGHDTNCEVNSDRKAFRIVERLLEED